MQPIIRLTNYIEEYKRLVYDEYAKATNIVYSTYFQLNQETTQYDPHYLQTFHKTGEFSGRKYKKIHMLPITLIQQILPTMDAGERGVSFAYNALTAFTIDSSVYVTPHVGDIMRFTISGDYADWEVTNVELSALLDKSFYRCSIKQTRLREHFDEQIDSEYMYIEYMKRVASITDATNFVYLMSRFTEIVHFLNSKVCYNHNLAYHTHNKNCFPELEVLLSTLQDTMIPVGNIFMAHDYNVSINTASVFMLLCLPKIFDINIKPIFTFDKTTNQINIRNSVYINYKEYLTTEDGEFDIEELLDNDLIKLRSALLIDFLKNKDTEYGTEEEPTTYMDAYTSRSNDVFTNLIDEWIQFISTNVEVYVSEHKTATNMFEGIIEYCLVSNKLISLK